MASHILHTDEELVKLLRNGDQQAFTELYNRHHAGVYRYQLTFVKVPAIAEDLVQEVFVKIWNARQKLQIHTSFTAYLYRTSRNVVIDMLKKAAADAALRRKMQEHLQPAIADTNEELMLKKYQQLYQQAVESLTPQRRTVFLLCREEGKSYEEVARIMGISRNTVKEHMSNALQSLRDFLAAKTELALLLTLAYRLF